MLLQPLGTRRTKTSHRISNLSTYGRFFPVFGKLHLSQNQTKPNKNLQIYWYVHYLKSQFLTLLTKYMTWLGTSTKSRLSGQRSYYEIQIS
jgi:hypothetical protein